MRHHAKSQAGVALAAASLLLAAGAALAQSTATPPASTAIAPSTKQSGATAWQLLVGNTAVASSRTGNYTEFFAPDGVVKHLDRDGKATGKWTLEGQKVCFDFPEEDDRSCVEVEVQGTRGAFIDEDASRDVFEILTGNAKDL